MADKDAQTLAGVYQEFSKLGNNFPLSQQWVHFIALHPEDIPLHITQHYSCKVIYKAQILATAEINIQRSMIWIN